MRKRSLQHLILNGGASLTLLAGLVYAQATKPAGEPKKTVTESGLTIIEQPTERSSAVERGDTVWVHYAGRLADGTEFDASTKHDNTRREGFSFMVGLGQVIAGWEEGLIGMKVGEKRQLIIPANLGYGAAGSPPRIPANATLTFDIELLALRKGPKM